MASGVSRVMTGSVLGTGADLDVRTVGFRPSVVQLINEASSDKLTWTDKMADGAGHKQLAAGASSFITTLGITPLSDGFRLGVDADLNVADELVHWIAYE